MIAYRRAAGVGKGKIPPTTDVEILMPAWQGTAHHEQPQAPVRESEISCDSCASRCACIDQWFERDQVTALSV
jgi:hypothetical protein